MRQPQQTSENPITTLPNRATMKRSHNLVLFSAALILSASVVDGFSSLPFSSGTRKHLHTSFHNGNNRQSLRPVPWNSDVKANELYASKADRSEEKTESRFRVRRRVKSILSASRSNRSEAKTESRFKVRKRVRSVLEKAKNRTGIENSSEERLLKTDQRLFKTEQTGLDVIAEAASIGGLGAVVVDESGSVDVALNYAPKKKNNRSATTVNGQKTDTVSTTSSITDSSVTVAIPASTPSPGPRPISNPEDDFVVAANTPSVEERSPSVEVDALKADVSAAFSMPAAPLPFTLPTLTEDQERQLEAGERLQQQSKMAREGSGYVVLDVKAPPYVVWECLLDFESYPETIPTVRSVQMFTSTHLKSGYRAEKPVNPGTGKETRHYGTPSLTRAAFTLSKFKLNIAAVHKYRPHPEGDYMVFELDQGSKNIVLQKAKGVWHTEAEVRPGYTRVWLLCELRVSRALPSFIVDYAAERAMPRATTWLKPQVEAAAELWLKSDNAK
mmetsp:Transcript_19686/g.30352  ORF Transcript_19686/g.30352 Transcript_19686/m.30352 type:complete len:501 (-) Transcript_19686:330-1832(-)|eukprot:CAMPEP_0195302754 /NCGR_PEP_ID=MMETSP0707-20130614/31601_1 /TAXON_ID=33640 /ORGANISM="Asterionellopsis glacialis, Strain CCMP134" /LENGTH=500 /DNA_ID=CAMNT_0040366089 /DNA_START=24 /DNA_END=1526 /DNA_ORIENTATION=+